MLCLSRRVGERIIIGNDIAITVVSINHRDGKVRLGIVAPQEVSVHREEVWQAIHEGREPK